MVTEPMAVPEDSSPTTFSEGTHRRWRRTWLVGSRRTGHRGVSTRCRGALVLASLLTIASAGACGTSSDNESSTTRASVAPIDPAELADPGPHGVGTASLSFPNGDDEPLSVIAYYPAIAEESSATRDAEPDPSAAPYPVVLGNTNMAEVVGLHLVVPRLRVSRTLYAAHHRRGGWGNRVQRCSRWSCCTRSTSAHRDRGHRSRRCHGVLG